LLGEFLRLDELGKTLPADQLAEAQKLSQQYLEKYGSSNN